MVLFPLTIAGTFVLYILIGLLCRVFGQSNDLSGSAESSDGNEI